MEERLQKLEEVTKIQCSPGNYDVNEYMRGMANGLICALAILKDQTPEYINPPENTEVSEGV